jgi:flagellin-specific chaperone FliS
MIQRLTAANIGNDVAILAEVESLLGDLLGAWEGIKPQQQNAFVPQQPSEYTGAGYGRL